MWIFALACAPRAPVGPAAITAPALRSDVERLASDAFGGRETGSPEIERAAAYIARRFEAAGLVPLTGEDDLLDEFTLYRRGFYAVGTTLAVDGQEVPLGRGFRPFDFSDGGEVEGEVVFAGYGISSPAWDDYRDLDVRDKIVLVLRHHPGEGSADGPFGAEEPREAWFVEKAKQAASRGALATLIVTDPLHHPDAAEDLRLSREYSLDRPAAPPAQEAPPLRAVQITLPVAQRLVAGDLLALQEQVDRGVAPATLPRAGVRARVAVHPIRMPEPTTHTNVVGVLRGSRRPYEWVVVGAHYDHLGRFDGEGDTVFNGADDNASGTSALLALADAFAHLPRPPERSIVFIAYSGEEKGLLGSRAWVREHGAENVVFTLVLDMIGRNPDQPLSALGDGTGTGLTDTLRQAALAEGLGAVAAGGDAYVGRSDYAALFERDVPYVHLFTGEHADYHQITDEADKLDYDRAAAIARTAFRVIEPIARGELTPELLLRVDWLGLDLVGHRIAAVTPGRRAASAGLAVGDEIVKVGTERLPIGGALRGVEEGATTTIVARRAGQAMSFEVTRTPAGYLGVDFGEAPAGALLKEVIADGPAQRAGLATGDVITAIGGVPVTAANLRRVLEGLGAGATVPCAITRGADPLTVDVTLGARP